MNPMRPLHAGRDRRPSVPGGVWASALRTRLCATWARRSASPTTTTGGPGTSVQLVVVRHRVRVAHGVGADAVQVDRLGPQRPAPVQLGQQQEVLDQAAHPGRLLLDPLERLVPPRLVGEPAPAQQLGVAPDRGERRPQLVRGVGHELAQPLLGGRLLGEGRLDLAQHLVQGRPQPADLGARRAPRARVGSGRPRRWRRPSRPSGAGAAARAAPRAATSTPMARSTARLAKISTLRSEFSVSLVGFSDKRRDQRPLRHRDGDRCGTGRRGRR